MSSSRLTHFLLLVCMIVCAGMTSCKPLDWRATAGKPTDGTERQARKWSEWVLLREEIIEIANIVAREQGYDPAESLVLYDEGRVRWRWAAIREIWEPCVVDGCKKWREVEDDEFETAVAKRWPMLKGRDYQLVLYFHRGTGDKGPIAGLQAGKWILIDRNTGATLLVLP